MPKPLSPPSQPQSRPALSRAEDVARHCRVDIRTVRRWIANGDLPVLRLGRAVRITENDLERFLQRSRQSRP
jgi:excisionase family DNA binding protein